MSWKLAEWRWRQEAGLSDAPLKRRGNLEAMKKRAIERGQGHEVFAVEEDQEREMCLPEEHHILGHVRPASDEAEFRCPTRLSINLSQASTPPGRCYHRTTHTTSYTSPSSIVPLLQPSTPLSCPPRRLQEDCLSIESSSSLSKQSSCEESSSIDRLTQRPRDFLRPSRRPSRLPDSLQGRPSEKPPATGFAIEIFINQDTIWPIQRTAQQGGTQFDASFSSVNLSAFPKPPRTQPKFEQPLSQQILALEQESLQYISLTTSSSSTEERLIRPQQILELEKTIFELLNAHESLIDHVIVSPEDSCPKTKDFDFADVCTMSEENPFRSGKAMMPPRRKDTPPRTIFPDFEAAHSAIASSKMPSSTPDMENMDDPHAMLPPCIDLPSTPERPQPGPASDEVRKRLASNSSAERRLSPLLPPAPNFDMRSSTSSSPTSYKRQNAARLQRTEEAPKGADPEGDLKRVATLSGFGPDDIPLRRLRRVASVESSLRQPALFPQTEHNFPFPVLPGLLEHHFSSPSTIESIVDRYRGAAPRAPTSLGSDAGELATDVDRYKINEPIGVAISEEIDWTKHVGGSNADKVEGASPHSVGRFRSGTAGCPPDKPLPPLPRELLPATCHQPQLLSSVFGCDDDTKSLLNLRTPLGRSQYAAVRSVHTRLPEYGNVQSPQAWTASTTGGPAVGSRDVMDDFDDAFKIRGVHREGHATHSALPTSIDILDLAEGAVFQDQPSFSLGRDDDGILRVDSTIAGLEVASKQKFPESGITTQNRQTTQSRRPSGSDLSEHKNDDNDWETIKSQFETQRSLRRVRTEQSLANVSSYGSLTKSARPASPWGPLARMSGGSSYHEYPLYKKGSKDLTETWGRCIEGRERGIGSFPPRGLNVEQELFPPRRAFLSHQQQTLSSSRRQQSQIDISDNHFFSSPTTFESSPAQQSSTLLPPRVRQMMASTQEVHTLDKETPSKLPSLELDQVSESDNRGETQQDPESIQQVKETYHGDGIAETRFGKQSTNPATLAPPTTDDTGANHDEELRKARAGKKRAGNKRRGKKRAKAKNAPEELSQYSKVSEDGSYPNDDASNASLIREATPKVPEQQDTFKKVSIVGPKANITGTLRGTGMRETGSSPANYSDSVDPGEEGTMTSQQIEAEFAKRLAILDKYKHGDDDEAGNPLDDWSLLFEPGKVPAALSSGQKKAPEKPIFPHGWSLPTFGLNNIKDSQLKVHTGVAFADGATVSAPHKILDRPWNLAPGNTFERNFARDLGRGVPEGRVKTRLESGLSDILRLKSECPVFPLDAAHTTLTFENPRFGRVGRARAERATTSSGKAEEKMFCRKHLRWEFSEPPVLHRDRAVREAEAAAVAAVAAGAAGAGGGEEDPVAFLRKAAVVVGAVFVVVLAVLVAVLVRS